MTTNNFDLTGNPFVDTGLTVIAELAKVDSIQELTKAHLEHVYKDGKQLASWNSRLKSFTMVFGTNGPLTQSQYRPKDKRKTISERNIALYCEILGRFLQEIGATSGAPCESCGSPTNIDFNAICRESLKKCGENVAENKWIGRDWFPLSGSFGNDAQIFPAASRPLNICPKCLFAVHYLPLGLMLIQGRLACFQSTSQLLAQDIITTIMEENLSSLKAVSDKVEIIGKKEGSAVVIRRLLTLFDRLRNFRRMEFLPEHATLTVWLFSNSGTGADCRIVEIPNYALQFLWEAVQEGYRNEIERLLSSEGKDPIFQMLTCIRERRDYSNLYPFKKHEGASAQFYAFYQTRICQKTIGALSVAHKIASSLVDGLKAPDLKNLRKSEAFRDRTNHNKVRRLMARLIENGEMSLSDYDSLFPTTRRHPIQVNRGGWQLFRFYVHHTNPEDNPERENLKGGDESVKTMHPQITQASALYFSDYVDRRGIERFKRDILDRFDRGEIGLLWLRDLFVRLAQKYEGFTLGDWDEFVHDEDGRPVAYELLFQMRLALANLYRQYLKNKETNQ